MVRRLRNRNFFNNTKFSQTFHLKQKWQSIEDDRTVCEFGDNGDDWSITAAPPTPKKAEENGKTTVLIIAMLICV